MDHRSTIKKVYEEVRIKIKDFNNYGDHHRNSPFCSDTREEINSKFKRAQGWSKQRTKTMKKKIIKGLIYIYNCMIPAQDFNRVKTLERYDKKLGKSKLLEHAETYRFIIDKLIEIECCDQNLNLNLNSDFFDYEPISETDFKGLRENLDAMVYELKEILSELNRDEIDQAKLERERAGEEIKEQEKISKCIEKKRREWPESEPEIFDEDDARYECIQGLASEEFDKMYGSREEIKEARAMRKKTSGEQQELEELGIFIVNKNEKNFGRTKMKQYFLRIIDDYIVWSKHKELVDEWTGDNNEGKSGMEGPYKLISINNKEGSELEYEFLYEDKEEGKTAEFIFLSEDAIHSDKFSKFLSHDIQLEDESTGVSQDTRDIFLAEVGALSQKREGPPTGTLGEWTDDDVELKLLDPGVSNSRVSLKNKGKPEINNESKGGSIFEGVMLMSRPSDIKGGGGERFFVVDNDCKISWKRKRLGWSDSRSKPPRRLVQVKKVRQKRMGGGDKLIIYIEGGLDTLKDRAKSYGISDKDINAAGKSKQAVIELILKKSNTSGEKRAVLEYELNEMKTDETIHVRNTKKGGDKVNELWEALTTYASCKSVEGTTDSGEKFMRFEHGTHLALYEVSEEQGDQE